MRKLWPAWKAAGHERVPFRFSRDGSSTGSTLFARRRAAYRACGARLLILTKHESRPG